MLGVRELSAEGIHTGKFPLRTCPKVLRHFFNPIRLTRYSSALGHVA